MKYARIHPLAGLALAALVLVSAFGCTSPQEERLSALEAEVSALKERDAANREELAAISKNLEAIRGLLTIDRERSRLEEDGDAEKGPDAKALKEKAREMVDKNLDRLIEVTKKLLDKMEKELDEQLGKMNKPAPPQGDEI